MPAAPEETLLTPDYARLTTVLWAVVKGQQAAISALDQRVAQLVRAAPWPRRARAQLLPQDPRFTPHRLLHPLLHVRLNLATAATQEGAGDTQAQLLAHEGQKPSFSSPTEKEHAPPPWALCSRNSSAAVRCYSLTTSSAVTTRCGLRAPRTAGTRPPAGMWRRRARTPRPLHGRGRRPRRKTLPH